MAGISPAGPVPEKAPGPGSVVSPPDLGHPLTCLGGFPPGSPIPRGEQGRAGRPEEEDEAAQTGAIAFTHLRGSADRSGPPQTGPGSGLGRGYRRRGGVSGEGGVGRGKRAPPFAAGNRGVAPPGPRLPVRPRPHWAVVKETSRAASGPVLSPGGTGPKAQPVSPVSGLSPGGLLVRSGPHLQAGLPAATLRAAVLHAGPSPGAVGGNRLRPRPR